MSDFAMYRVSYKQNGEEYSVDVMAHSLDRATQLVRNEDEKNRSEIIAERLFSYPY